MIPIADEGPRRYIPVVNYFIILANIIVFYIQPVQATEALAFFQRYGLVPVHIQRATELWDFYPFITSAFVHGDIFHLLGNLLFLWIFGDNIEYVLGHGRYLVFYLTVGAGAAISQMLFNMDSLLPMVGASGAISGVLGAYLVKFPRNKISVLVFLFIIIRVIKIPAVLALGLWFLFQVYNGYLSHYIASANDGIAWMAHIGGFISGLILIKMFEWYPHYR